MNGPHLRYLPTWQVTWHASLISISRLGSHLVFQLNKFFNKCTVHQYHHFFFLDHAQKTARQDARQRKGLGIIRPGYR